MSSPLSLFDLPEPLPPFAAGSPTSKDAARRVSSAPTVTERHLDAIRKHLRKAAQWGATQKELASRLGIQRATVAARVNYLAGGKIKDGQRTLEVEIVATTRRRQNCAVYVLKQFYGSAAA
jgi:hypothetical protein